MTRRTLPLWARPVMFVALVTLAFWPSTTGRRLVSEVGCAILSPFLSHTTFEGQTHIHVEPLPPVSTASVRRNVAADTALVLRLSRYSGEMRVELSLRRDLYLPLVLFAAMIAVSPLSWRRRAALSAVGFTLILAVAVGSIYVLLANIYSGRFALAPQLSEVYPVSEGFGDVLQFLHERWLTPPANRVIAPLLLGALLLALDWEKLWRSSSNVVTG
jgi:hypothetical protein